MSIEERARELAAREGYWVVMRPVPERMGGGYELRIPELAGCVAAVDAGASLAGALDLVDDAKRGWIDAALEAGRGVPPPAEGDIEMDDLPPMPLPRSRVACWVRAIDRAGIRLLDTLLRTRLISEATYERWDLDLAWWTAAHEELWSRGRWRRLRFTEGRGWHFE